jgi:hypothetical protein
MVYLKSRKQLIQRPISTKDTHINAYIKNLASKHLQSIEQEMLPKPTEMQRSKQKPSVASSDKICSKPSGELHQLLIPLGEEPKICLADSSMFSRFPKHQSLPITNILLTIPCHTYVHYFPLVLRKRGRSNLYSCIILKPRKR